MPAWHESIGPLIVLLLDGMRVLLIGGSGFIGPFVRAELERHGHEVFVFHRARTYAAAGRGEIFGDRRRLADSARELRALGPDVVIDLILSSGSSR